MCHCYQTVPVLRTLKKKNKGNTVLRQQHMNINVVRSVEMRIWLLRCYEIGGAYTRIILILSTD